MDKAIPIQDIDIDLGKDSRYVLITCRQIHQVVNSCVLVRCAVMSKKATRTTIGNNVSLTIIQYLRMPLQLLNLKKLAYNVTSQANLVNRRCLLYTSPSPRDKRQSRMPSSA